MSLRKLPIHVFCLIVMQTVQQTVSVGHTHRFMTFNAGLVNYNKNVDARAEKLPNLLSSDESDADIVCLQEVFSGSHVKRITDEVKAKYPYSNSYLHDNNGKLSRFVNIMASAPCQGPTVYVAALCILLYCGMEVGNKENIFTCATLKCSGLSLVTPECSTCFAVNMPSVKDVIRNCMLFTSPAFNLHGVLLLSKTPLKNQVSTQFNPGMRVAPRFYLESDVDGIGSVVCTHMTSAYDGIYLEARKPFVFSSWSERNKKEAQILSKIAQEKQKVVIIGDLNTGPSIPEIGITPEVPDSFKELAGSGLESPYLQLVGKPTFRGSTVIIDHVMHKGFTAVSAKRVFETANVDGTPISDHYGVEVSLKSD